MPGTDPLPGPIVAGVDGALYVAEVNDNVISRLTTAGVFTDEYALPRENATPVAMAAGPDRALYVSEHSTGKVSRMTLKGRFTGRYKVPGGFNDGLAFARDGALWVTRAASASSPASTSTGDADLSHPDSRGLTPSLAVTQGV